MGCGTAVASASQTPTPGSQPSLAGRATMGKKNLIPTAPDVFIWQLSPGETLCNGRYVVEGLLGRGGMGIVYKVLDRARKDTAFALKMLPESLAQDHHALEDLHDEIESAQRLRNDGIVAVWDLVDDQGSYAIKMEYVDGPSLRGVLRDRKQLPGEEIVSLGLQACEALQYAHEHRVIHQDIKPGNLMLTSSGRLKVADFGLAVTLEASLSHMSLKGHASGTPYYMSPEQYRGKRVSFQSDVYSLGMTLYELAAGRVPFRGRGFEYQLLNEQADPIEGIPSWLNEVLLVCLRKDADERPASMAELAQLLSEGPKLLGGAPPAPPPPPAPSPPSSGVLGRLFGRGSGSQGASNSGWHNEPLPSGMAKTSEKNVYLHDTGNGLKIEMVYVPPGEFTMGESGWAEPEHKHPMPHGYYIGRFPTTWREYLAFCKATGRGKPDAPNWGIKDDHPVVNVSWDDAKAFCDWAGLALPSEAMWEKASRGTDGRERPWGNEEPTPDRCVWDGHPQYGDKSTAPVGPKERPRGASPYGAHDMAGNVWEWCEDWYDSDAYKCYASGDTTPPSSGSYRVYRGGSWRIVADYARCAFRNCAHPSDRNDLLGFRPARVITGG